VQATIGKEKRENQKEQNITIRASSQREKGGKTKTKINMLPKKKNMDEEQSLCLSLLGLSGMIN